MLIMEKKDLSDVKDVKPTSILIFHSRIMG
jgi:hypothetical protein